MLSELLADLPVTLPEGKNLYFEGIETHSKKVSVNNLYMELSDKKESAEGYIREALDKKASVVLTDKTEFLGMEKVLYVPELKNNSNKLLNRYFNYPAEKYFSVAVTGTNGKSTISHLSASLLNKNAGKSVLLGTIENRIGDKVFPAELTTPDAVDLMRYLDMGIEAGCKNLVMEASSHALHQGRLSEISFDRCIFTNLTQDHLDYHKNFENYFKAKSLLFTDYLKPGGVSLINLDSDYGIRLADSLSTDVIGFSSNPKSKFPFPCVTLVDSRLGMEGTELRAGFEGKEYDFKSGLLGQINIENLLATISLGFSLGYSESQIQAGIANVFVPGRNQVFSLANQSIAVVDYAHTPDALERVLKSFRPLVTGKLYCLFGCGGDRDKTKRPLMARLAEKCADGLCITNDNPRTENPEFILKDILSGLEKKQTALVELDRARAIHLMLGKLRKGDCLVVAGKGHEDYQILGTQKIFFSDTDVIERWINSKTGENS